MAVRLPTSETVTVHTNSRIWQEFEHRPGDIVISTPPKSGTTWMQGIVAALLWPDGDVPGVPFEISPWIDMRPSRERGSLQRLDEQEHRRFIKTHSPADAIPIDDDCRYVTVHRDLRDVTVSWANHRSKMQPGFVEHLNELAADAQVPPLDPVWGGDYDHLIEELANDLAFDRHLASWWPLRDRENVLFVHFADLLADLEGEMRRLAAFLDLPVTEEQWPEVVDRCTIDQMREVGRTSEGLAGAFDGGADAFFNRGTNGRWQGVLADSQLARLAEMNAALPPDAAEWQQHGSLALGRRP